MDYLDVEGDLLTDLDHHSKLEQLLLVWCSRRNAILVNDDEIQIAKENTVTKLTKLFLPRVCVWEGEGAECINERKNLFLDQWSISSAVLILSCTLCFCLLLIQNVSRGLLKLFIQKGLQR